MVLRSAARARSKLIQLYPTPPYIHPQFYMFIVTFLLNLSLYGIYPSGIIPSFHARHPPILLSACPTSRLILVSLALL